MTLVNADTGEVVESVALTEAQARRIVARINGTGAELVDLVEEAWRGRAWLALGYGSWDDLCEAEIQMPRLDRERRREMVGSLRQLGMSTRAIASATGVVKGTIDNDLAAGGHKWPGAEPTEPDVAPILKGQPTVKAPLKPIIGIDGKTYKPKAKPVGRTKAQRLIDIRQLAERGNNAEQIARELGLTRRVVVDYAAEVGIPLTDNYAKSKKHDANRIVSETVGILDGAAFGVRLVELNELDPTEIEGWVTSLSDSLKSLNSFTRQLKEMTR